LLESEQARKTPDFNTRLAHKAIKGGLLRVVVTAAVLYTLIRVLFRGDLEKIWSSWYFWIIPFLGIVSMPLVGIFICMDSVIKAFSVILGKRKWINDAAREKAIIIDKRKRQDYESDDYYSYSVMFAELKLKYSPTLAINNSSEQTLWAGINYFDYEKYEVDDVVDIYYSITDPSVFLIEGE
jgi:hypothetical protein